MLYSCLFSSSEKQKQKSRKAEKQKNYGALAFPRFEIFLMILALPCVCEASASLVKGGSTSGVIVGILLLGVVSFLLLALLFFLSIVITFGKLLQYKEVHTEGQSSHWSSQNLCLLFLNLYDTTQE